MKILMWATALIALLGMFPAAWLGVNYVWGSGHGLHPALSALGVAVLFGLGYAAATLADEFDR